MKKIIFLLLGIGIGSGATFLITRDRYERKLKNEREKMVEEINELQNKTKEESKNIEQEIKKISKEYSSDEISDTLNEDNTHKISINAKSITVNGKTYSENNNVIDNQLTFDDIKEKPYIISSDEFDTKGYEVRYWYLYNDDVLTDENNNLLTTQEVEYSLGDCLKNEWDDEYVLHIRNDYDETDYEIKKIDSDYIEDEEDIDEEL